LKKIIIEISWTNATIYVILSPKLSVKKLVISSQSKANYAEKNDSNIGFHENRQRFCENWLKSPYRYVPM
jgi:hypothetical protein